MKKISQETIDSVVATIVTAAGKIWNDHNKEPKDTIPSMLVGIMSYLSIIGYSNTEVLDFSKAVKAALQSIRYSASGKSLV